ncbi:MAG: hypothetical protein LCI00_01630 [Chloroflexi bacterium]|nr:hypothetical protein [Chloroflexota bacterium]MCC6895607.1 hypothetical protein [Anaerolineae bacterium]
MMPSHHWARNFAVDKDDIEYLTNLLLERETPLDTETLARELVESRISDEVATLRQRYQDARIYDPARAYEVGQKLIFTEFDYETGVVVGIRPGNNPDYGSFNVIAVKFDDDDLNADDENREFATELTLEHDLNNAEAEDGVGSANDLNADEIISSSGKEITKKLEDKLRASQDLIYMARKWFPRDLLMEVNVGHLNLAEAVLDISGGGPMTTEAILNEIGGLGKAPMALQVFSMNYGLNQDDRFDEVGPTGEVLWHLTRLEPEEVQHTPNMLRYSPIEYDRNLLSKELMTIEAELDDEFSNESDIDIPDDLQETQITLTYPHRRLGTLPLSDRTALIFPTARQTPRVAFTLVDGQDGEEYPAWVVRKDRYVYGLAKFYRKHKLPIGAYVSVRKGEDSGKVIVDFKSHKPRTEWIRLIVPKGDQINFENHKRAIGAEYDDLMILGAEDLAGVDALFTNAQQQKKSLVAILRSIIPPLGSLTPQGTVHAKTIYSAVNVLRRCPPGPIFAVLVANPDFQNVGGDYWKLSHE